MPLHVLPLGLCALTACSRPIMLTASHLLKNASRSWITGPTSGLVLEVMWDGGSSRQPLPGAGYKFLAHREGPWRGRGQVLAVAFVLAREGSSFLVRSLACGAGHVGCCGGIFVSSQSFLGGRIRRGYPRDCAWPRGCSGPGA